MHVGACGSCSAHFDSTGAFGSPLQLLYVAESAYESPVAHEQSASDQKVCAQVWKVDPRLAMMLS